MAQLLYPSYEIRKQFNLPTDLSDPYLIENTLKSVSNKYGCVYMYDSDMEDVMQYPDVVYKMKTTLHNGGKNDTITVWHDILKVPRSGCISPKGAWMITYIIKDYVYHIYKSQKNRYQVASSIMANNHGDCIVVLTICTMAYDTYIPLDISQNTLYSKSCILRDIISNKVGRMHKVGYVSSEGVLYKYQDYKNPNMKDVIIFMD